MKILRSLAIAAIAAGFTLILAAQDLAQASFAPDTLTGVTTAQLKSALNWKSYRYITTSGYYASGDAGGGVTYYNAGTTACTPNGGSIIMDQAGTGSGQGNCWYATTFPSNILQWGAKPDSPTNNAGSNVTDNDPFIFAAVTACKATTLPSGSLKTGCTLRFPFSTKSYATSGRYDLRDANGINIVCEGSGSTIIKAIGSSTSPMFQYGSTGTTLVNSGFMQGCNLNANGIANVALELRGMSSGQFTDITLENALLANLVLEDSAAGTTNGQTLYNKFYGIFIFADFHTLWSSSVARPNYTSLGISINDNTSSLGCTNPDTCTFDTSHVNAVRMSEFHNCFVIAQDTGVAIRTGWANGDTFSCIIKNRSDGAQSNLTTVTGTVGTPVITIPSANVTSLTPYSTVTDTKGRIPANTYIISCSPSLANCTTATMNNNIVSADIDSNDKVTIDGTAPRAIATLTTGTPNWTNGTPSGLSQFIALNHAIPTLMLGDYVSDITTPGNLACDGSSTACTSGQAANYVIACNANPCSSATSIKLAYPALGAASDVLLFGTSHYAVEMQATPIGTGGNGNGPAWHESFTVSQTGPNTVRNENLYRPPMSFSFPNGGIAENNSFVVQNSTNRGFKSVTQDPGSFMIFTHDTGDSIGQVHAGEIYEVANQATDVRSHVFSESLRSQFLNGTAQPAITAVADSDTPSVPPVQVWDTAVTNAGSMGVSAASGDLALNTGTNQSAGVALKIVSISECSSDGVTTQYQQCATVANGGNVLVTVASGDPATYNLFKLQTVSITGVNGYQLNSLIADGTSTAGTCNANVTDQLKPLDQSHFYLPDTAWYQTGCAAGHVNAYVSGGMLWAFNMDVQRVFATAANGGNIQVTVGATSGLSTSSKCTTANVAPAGDNLEMVQILSIDSTTTLTLNHAVSGGEGASGGFIACQPINEPQNLVTNQGIGASNYGRLTTRTVVQASDVAEDLTAPLATADTGSAGTNLKLTAAVATNIGTVVIDRTTPANLPTKVYVTACSPNCGAATSVTLSAAIVSDPVGNSLRFGGLVELNSSGASGDFSKIATGQYVALSGSKNSAVNGLHPVRAVSTTLLAATDLPYLGSASYGYSDSSAKMTMTWLDPAMKIECAGQATRATPSTINNLQAWELYCDANDSNKLKAIQSTTGTVINLSSLASLPSVVCANGTPVSAPSDNTEHILATCTVPGGTMGANGCVVVDLNFGFTGSTNPKSFGIRFNASGTITGSQYLTGSTSTSGNVAAHWTIPICNANSVSSQLGTRANNADTGNGFSGSAPQTSAINTASDSFVVITGTTTETLTLERYMVQAWPHT